MKKKALEMKLQQIAPHPEPKPDLEQYNTPAVIAADVLFIAHSLGDIENRKVTDLGCGTGIFGIGAKLMGAKEVTGIDIDKKAIEAAKENAKRLGVKVALRVCEIKDYKEDCDTVLQNPPFGAQKRHADRPFLERALTISNVVYSLHLTKTREFIKREVRKLGAVITHTNRYKFEIKHIFEFHTKEKENVDVTLFRIKGKGE